MTLRRVLFSGKCELSLPGEAGLATVLCWVDRVHSAHEGFCCLPSERCFLNSWPRVGLLLGVESSRHNRGAGGPGLRRSTVQKDGPRVLHGEEGKHFIDKAACCMASWEGKEAAGTQGGVGNVLDLPSRQFPAARAAFHCPASFTAVSHPLPTYLLLLISYLNWFWKE